MEPTPRKKKEGNAGSSLPPDRPSRPLLRLLLPVADLKVAVHADRIAASPTRTMPSSTCTIPVVRVTSLNFIDIWGFHRAEEGGGITC